MHAPFLAAAFDCGFDSIEERQDAVARVVPEIDVCEWNDIVWHGLALELSNRLYPAIMKHNY